MAYVALPAYRAPTGLDFSGLNEGVDVFLANREKNRLLEQAKAVGAATMTPQAAAEPAQNPLLRSMPAQPVASGLATNAADFLKREEGYAPQAKWDVRQHSGGYGSSAAPGETFTPQKAETYLRRDMAPAEAWINRNVPNATPEQRTALTSFGYNLGTDDLDRLLPDIRSGDWGRVAARMQTFNKARTGPGGALQELPGLTARRQREAALVAGQGAPAQPAGPNYRAAANVAFSQGNIALGTQLLQQQQELDNQAYTRGRQTQMDARQQEQWQAGHGLQEAQNRRAEASAGREAETAEDAREKTFISRAGAVSQTIRAETDPANRKMLWDRLVSSNPRWGAFLQQYGVDPGDVENGTKFLISMAQGASGKKYGTTLSYDSTGNAFVMGEDGTPKIVASPGGGAVLPRGVQMVDQETQVTPTLGGRPVGPALPKNVAAAATQKTVGEEQGKAQVDLPRVRSNSNAVLAQIDGVLGDPYLQSMTGPIQGRLPNLSGDANRVQSKVDQLNGQAFLQAFNSIKGGGAITETEGQKATQAWSRVQNMNVNDKDYPQALRDFRSEVVRLLSLAEEKAGVKPAGAPTGQSDAPEQGAPVQVQSVEEAMRLQPGTVFITPDGRQKVR